MDWRKITSHLYDNIKPLSGKILSTISNHRASSQNHGIQFSNYWIEFEMNEFTYEDPFYGEVKSTDSFEMFVNLCDITFKNGLKEIFELENLTIEKIENHFDGAFSNSLALMPHYLSFGNIVGDEIEFEMKYSLTNSNSYGMMNGTLEEHLQSFGFIKLPLKICDLELHVNQENGLHELLNRLNPSIYDLKSYECIKPKTMELPFEIYVVKYKKIKPNLDD